MAHNGEELRLRPAGKLGLFLRSKLYPWLLAECGRNVFFGVDVTLRHPHKIRIGSDVSLDAMRAVVGSVDRPVNLLADPRFTVAELRATGAKRISLGSHFSRAAFAALRRAATEYRDEGTMTFADDARGLDLDGMFAS